VLYANTHSDEINLLISPRDETFGRKTRKWLSVLAGEASSRFSVGLGSAAAFDARLCELPNPEAVVDYFRWRQEDADRNALNAHCYWKLRAEGQDAQGATQILHGMSVSAKHDMLFARGINFNDLPNWQKRGVGVAWATAETTGTHPLTGESIVSARRHPEVLWDLPMHDDYSAFVRAVLAGTPQD
jgi:tRNA(His) guanylyltransferase